MKILKSHKTVAGKKLKPIKITTADFDVPRISFDPKKRLNRIGTEPHTTAQICIWDAAENPGLTIQPNTFVHQPPQYNADDGCWYVWLDIPDGVTQPTYKLEFNPRGFSQKEVRQSLVLTPAQDS